MFALVAAVAAAPVLLAAYYSGGSAKSAQNVERSTGGAGSEADWIPRNTWVYLENPIVMPKAIPGDSDQINLERPLGPVQQAMADQSNPVDAMKVLAKHESEKDRAIVGLWTEFFKPTREIITRSVDQPITQVHILKPGTMVDKNVTQGNRFWDQPVPRSTGIDRYYKRDQTVPFYLVP